MRIAIDAMGGDYAPESIVKGINLAKKNFQILSFSSTENLKQLKHI